MLKNYFLTAWRNMLRNKLYTAINVFCFSLGVSGAILISLYVLHELSFDRHHANHERIYRAETLYTIADVKNHIAITAFPLGLALKDEFAGIKNYVRFFEQHNVVVDSKNHKFLEEAIAYVDSTVFSVFTIPLLEGDAQRALAQPNMVVISKRYAHRYFGGLDVMGESLRINQQEFVVSGIMENFPETSHLQYDALLSMATLDQALVFSVNPSFFWSINSNFTFIELHQEASIEDIKNELEAFNNKYVNSMGEMLGAVGDFTFTPLGEVRFSSIMMSPNSASKTIVGVLILVGIFLVVVAAVNYTNLSTARAGMRAKEIGVRKSAGASKNQIFVQFLSESILLAFIALLVSLFLVELCLPGFNLLTDKNFVLWDVFRWPFIFYVAMIVLLSGLLGGFYPAVFMSKMNPAIILKGSKGNTGKTSALLRKILVVFQFLLSIMLISATLIVYMQLHYLKNKSLGFSTYDRLAVFIQNPELRNSIDMVKNEMQLNPNILQISKSSSVPGRDFSEYVIKPETPNGLMEATTTISFVDENYLDFFDLHLLVGENLPERPHGQSKNYNGVLINRAASRKFGWSDDPVGKQIFWEFNEDMIPQRNYRVVGMVEDHHILDLHHAIRPLMFVLPDTNIFYQHILIHHLPGKEAQVREFLYDTMMELDSKYIPQITSIEQGYQQQFKTEEKMGLMFGIFTIVCLLISFVGLFGLSGYISEQRKGEICIRKIMGASVFQILGLLYKEFSSLVLMAALIALPICFYLLEFWLNGFVYRIETYGWYLLLSAFSAYIVALLTVSYHTVSAAHSNPVDSISR